MVDEITIDKEGTLLFPEEPDAEELAELTAYLESKGFTPGRRAARRRGRDRAGRGRRRGAAGGGSTGKRS